MSLSPLQVERYENRVYPGCSSAAVYKAAAAALREAGYLIAASNEAEGSLRTAPQEELNATAEEGFRAVANKNATAWSIHVTPVPGGVALRAEPRAYTDGQLLHPTDLSAPFVQQMFSELYGRLDAQLVAACSASRPSSDAGK